MGLAHIQAAPDSPGLQGPGVDNPKILALPAAWTGQIPESVL
jgi:hypothetical protein